MPQLADLWRALAAQGFCHLMLFHRGLGRRSTCGLRVVLVGANWEAAASNWDFVPKPKRDSWFSQPFHLDLSLVFVHTPSAFQKRCCLIKMVGQGVLCMFAVEGPGEGSLLPSPKQGHAVEF